MTVQPADAPRPCRSWLPWGLVVAAFVAFAAWQGTLSRTASGAHWSVLATIVCALVVAVVVGRHRQRKSSLLWARDGLGAIAGDLTRRSRRPAPLVAGVGIWALLILAAIGWDLYSFSQEVPYLPTLSRVFGDVTDHEWGRALVFVGWLALGAYLTAGWRRRRTSGVARPAAEETP